MNNEEKILAILANMQNEMTEMKSDIKDVKGRLTTVEERISNVENNVLKTNIIIENDIKYSMQFLAEGHKTLVDRLWNTPEDIEDIKESVSILRFLQKAMAIDLNKLK